MDKEEKKQKKIITENRNVTIQKRETSFEGITEKLEQGPDGIYNMMTETKNALFTPKISITPHDLETISALREVRSAIIQWTEVLKHSVGKAAYIAKNAIIELSRDQYIIKQAYQKPIKFTHLTRSGGSRYIKLEDKSYIEVPNGALHIAGVSLMDYKTISAILCNYSRLKQDSSEQFEGDTWYLIQDFEALCDKALAPYPTYMQIVEMKIDGVPNCEIQSALQVNYTPEYISSLWRNKIPKIIAKCAQEEFVTFEYKRLKLPFKKCNVCGEKKPLHPLFFSKNKGSHDGYYSKCKKCRNQKGAAS